MKAIITMMTAISLGLIALSALASNRPIDAKMSHNYNSEEYQQSESFGNMVADGEYRIAVNDRHRNPGSEHAESRSGMVEFMRDWPFGNPPAADGTHQTDSRAGPRFK